MLVRIFQDNNWNHIEWYNGGAFLGSLSHNYLALRYVINRKKVFIMISFITPYGHVKYLAKQ